MMKRQIIRIFFLLIFGLGNQIYSTIAQIAPKNPQVPAMSSLGINWSPSTNMFTGAATLQVPLMNIDCPEFEYPLGLYYAYNGIKYADRASMIGLHWSMNIPMISRNVVDVDDFDEEKGYTFLPPENRNKEETDAPDIFDLSTPEGNVRFFFAYQKKTRGGKTVSATILYEDFPVFDIKYDYTTNTMHVETDKGNTYIFDKRVYTNNEIKILGSSGTKTESYVVSWYPSSIELKNSQKILFSYRSSAKKILTKSANIASVMYYNPFGGIVGPTTFGSEATMHTDELLLDEISWDYGKVAFGYTDRDDITRVSAGQKGNKLSEVVLYDKLNNIVNYFQLEQDYFRAADGSVRLKLTGLKDFGNSASNSPKRFSFVYNENGIPNYHNSFRHFGYDSVAFASGGLDEVRYPTGLKIKYDYERNDYDPQGDNNSTLHNKHLGFRVKTISNYDENNKLLTRKSYSYTNQSGRSSGKIFAKSNWYVYDEGKYIFATSANWFPPIYQNDLLGYEDVTVYDENADGSVNGGTRYSFFAQASKYYYGMPGAQADYDFRNGMMSKVTVLEGKSKNNLQESRIKFYTTETFSTESFTTTMYYVVPGFTAPVYSKDNKLRAFKVRRTQEFFEDFANTGSSNQFLYIQGSKYEYAPLNREEIRSQFLINKEEVFKGISNHDVKMSMEYFYPIDFKHPRTGHVVFNHLSKTGFNSVVEKIEKDPTGNVVAGMFTYYDMFDGVARPSKIYHFETNTPVLRDSLTKTTVRSTGVYEIDEHYKLRQKDFKYDLYGNVTSYTEGNRTTVFLYGYKGKYMIAKIENAQLAEVLSVLGGQLVLDNLNNPTVSDSYMSSKMNALRTTLSKSFITTYAYKPLVGMLSKTDDRGITEFYDYDGFNRLMAVRDHDGNILKTYCYNYQGQQVNCN